MRIVKCLLLTLIGLFLVFLFIHMFRFALFFCCDYLLFGLSSSLLLAFFLTFCFLFLSFLRSFRTLCSLILSNRNYTRQTNSYSCDGHAQLTLVLSLSSVAVFLDILASSFCPDRFLILLSPIFLFPVCE